MLRQSSSFFLLVLALLVCTATAFFHVAAPVAPHHVLFATKAETVRVCGEATCGGREGWLLKRKEGMRVLKETSTSPCDALAFGAHIIDISFILTVPEEDGAVGPGGEEDGRDQGHGGQGPLGRH